MNGIMALNILLVKSFLKKVKKFLLF